MPIPLSDPSRPWPVWLLDVLIITGDGLYTARLQRGIHPPIAGILPFYPVSWRKQSMHDREHASEYREPVASQPASYPKRILLAVTGKTPQIVTETLWALAMEKEQAFVPTEIRVLTTEEGRRHVVEKLLYREHGAFHALCRDWQLGPIHFNESCIQILRKDGLPVEDIVSPKDNEITADQVCAWIKAATSDPRAAIHVSLASGRKTMGDYAGYALPCSGAIRTGSLTSRSMNAMSA